MKKTVLLLATVFSISFSAFSQDLPPNPEPGQCYIKCLTLDEWEEKEVKVLVRPAYKVLEVVPAEYKDEEITVVVKPASKRFEYIPAVFRNETETVRVEDSYNEITIKEAEFGTDETVLTYQPKYNRYEWQTSMENCKSDDPRDCMVLCYVEYPEQKITVPIETLAADASFTKASKGGKEIQVTKKVIATPAQCKEIVIPEETRTIKTRVLVKDETVVEKVIPAEYRTEVVRELIQAGGVSVWEKIDCKLTTPNVLPIFYELGSARLTAESRNIIDKKLLALMKEKPLIRIEINSHTDSRGTAESNLDLSQRRAQSVVDYLASKGINRARLVARGYGETKLVNGCKDGVNCSEEQHAKNRRTEFRVLAN
jgi:outer membrane protein OmpA-like peptidoglycan-associated protein